MTLESHMSEGDQVTVREYIEMLMEEREKQEAVWRESQTQALELATKNMEHRLGFLNELRSSHEKDRNTLVQSEVFSRVIEGINVKIEALEKLMAGTVATMKVLIGVASIIGGLVGGIITHFLK